VCSHTQPHRHEMEWHALVNTHARTDRLTHAALRAQTHAWSSCVRTQPGFAAHAHSNRVSAHSNKVSAHSNKASAHSNRVSARCTHRSDRPHARMRTQEGIAALSHSDTMRSSLSGVVGRAPSMRWVLGCQGPKPPNPGRWQSHAVEFAQSSVGSSRRSHRRISLWVQGVHEPPGFTSPHRPRAYPYE
jgi:hypothetical protein